MQHGFIGKRGDMQSAQNDVGAPQAIHVSNCIGTICVGDVHLDHDKVRLIIQFEFLHVLILEVDLVVRRKVCSECGEAQWRKQGIFDGPPEGTLRLGKRW